jgi:hypothetical protein
MSALDGDGEADAGEQNQDDRAGHAFGRRNFGADKGSAAARARWVVVRHELKLKAVKPDESKPRRFQFICFHGFIISIRRSSFRRGG